MRRVRLRGVACVLAIVGAVSACSSGGDGGDGGTTPNASLILEILAGASQSGTVGQPAATAPAVTVTNSSGVPQAGVLVTFAVGSGGGAVSGATPTTDASGHASVGGWTLGTVAGVNTLTASVNGASGSPVTFSATGLAGAATGMTKVAGDGISSAAGMPVSMRPSVKVVDQYGNGVAGVTVTFAVASGAGVATGTTQTTGADGTATVGSWTLGNLVGVNTMTATASGLTGTATFSATGAPGPVATVVKVAGDNQMGVAGALLGVAPSVRLEDAFGNLISGQQVTFAVASGGGSVTGATPSTGATGIATAGGWTLGGTPGANTLTATASNVSATFTATGTAAFNATQYAGTYAGTWTNTTFGSVGTGNVVIAVNQGANTAQVTVNVTGNVLGASGVANSVSNGAYSTTGGAFNGNIAPMGDIAATISANGAIAATGTNVPGGGISGWTANGTITSTALTLNFTVNFNAGAPATGTITLTKQ